MNKIKPVYLIADKCNGCVSCMKRCPTEAIRVRDGKATIMYERCVGCGECVKICPFGAKKELHDSLKDIEKFEYKIALISPSAYGQFNNLTDTDYVLTGLKRMGFDAAEEVAEGAEYVSRATAEYIRRQDVKKPVISSACPAIVNLILMRYEHLVEYLSPMLQPEVVAARLALARAMDRTGFRREKIGVFLITQCAANVLELKRGEGAELIDGVLSFKEIYFPLLSEMNRIEKPEKLKRAGRLGVSWGTGTGEAIGLGTDNYLTASGMENVIGVLNDFEHDKLSRLDFVELNACVGGCVGGSLNIENPFLARTRIRLARKSTEEKLLPDFDRKTLRKEMPYRADNVFRLADNRMEAMKRLMTAKEIYEKLPKINCGSCGAPNCMAFAEDVVRGLNVKCKYLKDGF